jgi:hypothetical protein
MDDKPGCHDDLNFGDCDFRLWLIQTGGSIMAPAVRRLQYIKYYWWGLLLQLSRSLRSKIRRKCSWTWCYCFPWLSSAVNQSFCWRRSAPDVIWTLRNQTCQIQRYHSDGVCVMPCEMDPLCLFFVLKFGEFVFLDSKLWEHPSSRESYGPANGCLPWDPWVICPWLIICCRLSASNSLEVNANYALDPGHRFMALAFKRINFAHHYHS